MELCQLKEKNKTKVNDLCDDSGLLHTQDFDKANILNQQYAKTFNQKEHPGNNSSFADIPLQTEPMNVWIVLMQHEIPVDILYLD